MTNLREVKTSLVPILLEHVPLDDEQRYVLAHAQELEIPVQFVQYPVDTRTGQEKAALLERELGWLPSRVVMALFFSRRLDNGRTRRIGLVKPYRGMRTRTTDLFHKRLGMSEEEARRYGVNGGVPRGMSAGTCTPFPRTSLVGKGSEITDMIVYAGPFPDNTFVDVSLGGDRERFRTGLHIPYGGIRHILERQFGSDVVRPVVSLADQDRYDYRP